jgi:tRNA A-37 threonylcarbamoyl transferase component Bud32
MKKYKIIGKIVLGFIFEREQQDVLISPEDGKYLELIGGTVWYVTKDGQRHESITTANIIDVALGRGDIKEIQ